MVSLRQVLIGLGAVKLLSLSFLAFRVLHYFMHRASWEGFRGRWALITGASAGLGLALADELASRKLNLVLVARRGEVLTDITKRLEATYGIKAVGVAADLAKPGALSSIANQIPSPPDVVIANGGGLAEGNFRPFIDWKEEDISAAQQLTGGHVLDLIRHYLPTMIANSRGRILIVGSMCAQFPQYIIPYGTEKARLAAVAVGLHEELRYHRLGAVRTPGYIKTTKEHATSEPTLFLPGPEIVAKSMLDKFGLYGEPVVVPHWSHALQASILFSFLPRFIAISVIRSAIDPFVKRAAA